MFVPLCDLVVLDGIWASGECQRHTEYIGKKEYLPNSSYSLAGSCEILIKCFFYPLISVKILWILVCYLSATSEITLDQDNSLTSFFHGMIRNVEETIPQTNTCSERWWNVCGHMCVSSHVSDITDKESSKIIKIHQAFQQQS